MLSPLASFVLVLALVVPKPAWGCAATLGPPTAAPAGTSTSTPTSTSTSTSTTSTTTTATTTTACSCTVPTTNRRNTAVTQQACGTVATMCTLTNNAPAFLIRAADTDFCDGAATFITPTGTVGPTAAPTTTDLVFLECNDCSFDIRFVDTSATPDLVTEARGVTAITCA